MRKPEKSSLHALSYKHLENCRVLPNRYVMLDQLPKGGIGAELGVLGGDFSKELLHRIQPEKLYLVDTFCSDDWKATGRFAAKNHEAYINEFFQKEIQAGTVVIEKGLSWEVLKNLPDNSLDWIYVDADHTYEGVSKDLEQIKRVIKEAGYIMFNDYIMYDHVADEEYGVVQAVNEFCLENDWEFVYFALHPQLFCDVTIRKIR